MTTPLPYPVNPWYQVIGGDDDADFDTLEAAYEFAHTINFFRTGEDEYVQIFYVEADLDSMEFNPDNGELRTYSPKPGVLIDTLYDTDATSSARAKYNSPEAVAARQKAADERQAARELRLRRRPIIVNMPAYQERYDVQHDGSLRLKPEYRTPVTAG